MILPNLIDVQSYSFKMSPWEETHRRPLRICHLKQVRSDNWDGVKDREGTSLGWGLCQNKNKVWGSIAATNLELSFSPMFDGQNK